VAKANSRSGKEEGSEESGIEGKYQWRNKKNSIEKA